MGNIARGNSCPVIGRLVSQRLNPGTCPVDYRMNFTGTIRPVNDDVSIIPELHISGILSRGPCLERPESVLLHYEDEISDIHIRDHALGFDGHDRRPCATDQKESERNRSHDYQHPQEFPGCGDYFVVALLPAVYQGWLLLLSWRCRHRWLVIISGFYYKDGSGTVNGFQYLRHRLMTFFSKSPDLKPEWYPCL